MNTKSICKFLILLAVPAVWSGCGDSSGGNADLPAVQTVVVAERDLEETVNVSGFVKAETVTEIKSEINGRIIRIPVENGQFVQKGQLLCEIDPQTYQTTVDSHDRTVRQRQLSVEKSERDMKRIKQLFENDFASEEDYLNAVTSFESDKLQLEIAQAALDNAKIELAKTKIVAPHDGMISDLNVFVGNVISGAGSFSNGTTLMKINDMSSLRVEADLNEIECNKIKIGATARLSFDSIPGTHFTGTVNYLSSFGVQDSATLYKFPVRVNFTSGEQLVRPGTSANLAILVCSESGVPAIPTNAIFIENNKRYIFVKKAEHHFERREIKAGISTLDYVQILEGAKTGDVISTTRPSRSEIFDADGNAIAAGQKAKHKAANFGPPH
ncbi:MAG: efflux RND transporter periplasmic adaptor subunit [Opitutales bacterium]|nr:efflux RND transporter periplasmic adaptor subunit [Opitutales bacterium]